MICWNDFPATATGGMRFSIRRRRRRTDFAAKLAGALQIAAADVKVQVEFNPQRVISYRQIGYAKHQLTKEQFRDNTVAAARNRRAGGGQRALHG